MDQLMPKMFEWKGYRFFFFSNEGDPLEHIHVHVKKGENVAKFWVIPEVYLVSSWGMSPQELNMLENVVIAHKEQIMEKWNEYFYD